MLTLCSSSVKAVTGKFAPWANLALSEAVRRLHEPGLGRCDIPSWYIHLDVARRAIAVDALTNSSIGPQFPPPGNAQHEIAAEELSAIVNDDTAAYYALGAIGPDMFFLLPDFTPGKLTSPLWGASTWIHDTYTWWDTNFLKPLEQLLPAALTAADFANALSGGLAQQLANIFTEASTFITDVLAVAVTRQIDVFGALGNGPHSGADEQTFFWSDTPHYRKTFEFARFLWEQADKNWSPADHDLNQQLTAKPALRDRLRAYALGWMTHLATDVTGHAFVNEKAGGPYRTHWQRHHLVENHMDAAVYHENWKAHRRLSQKAPGEPIYEMLSCAALHTWVAFKEDGSSQMSFLSTIPGPDYDPGDDPPAVASRMKAWDVDALPPKLLTTFIADSLRAFYRPTDDPGGPGHVDVDVIAADGRMYGQMAAHPTIISDLDPGNTFGKDGFASPEAVGNTYWWAFHYMKATSTDLFKFKRPRLKDLNLPSFPLPPGSTDHDSPPSFSAALPDALTFLLYILDWLLYIKEVVRWLPAVIIAFFASNATYPVRKYLYEHYELPLYNMWMTMHLYFALTGFVLPHDGDLPAGPDKVAGEISSGLNTLGEGFDVDAGAFLVALLNDASGGLLSAIGVNPPITVPTQEPSASDRDQDNKPKDTVTDPPTSIQNLASGLLQQIDPRATLPGQCVNPANPRDQNAEIPSEFTRPWKYPLVDNAGDTIPPERSATGGSPPILSPYKAGDVATVLVQAEPGDANARQAFENAASEQFTLQAQQDYLPNKKHLGSPTDFTAYVMYRLTRLDPGAIANFNLDADRAYGYLCWDWKRSDAFFGVPDAYANATPDHDHKYNAPLRPGQGWCRFDVDRAKTNNHNPVNPPAPGLLTEHDPWQSPQPLGIRYIDKEPKF